MALPVKLNTWAISPCNRIAFVSLLATMGGSILGLKNLMKANGYTVKGSCDGTTGAMDGVDRITTAANFGTRGALVTNANSWVVLTSTNGADYLFSYVGASDDICRVSVSHQGDYVAAGTSNQTPTSANEQLISTAISIINGTASLDRLWSAWVVPGGHGWRFAVARAGSWNMIMGGEEFTQGVYSVGVTCNKEVGWVVSPANITTVGQIGIASPLSGTTGLCGYTSLATHLMNNIGWGCEASADASIAGCPSNQGIAPELQGGTQFILKRLFLWSNSANMRGKVGVHKDLYAGRTTGSSHGDYYGNVEWIQMGAIMVFPWDGTPSVAGTTIVMT